MAKKRDVYLRDIQLATKELTDELYINKDEKGEADGVATLDENGKVPITQLPSALLTYEGTWNAATNTPELSNDTVTESMKGQVYICTVAGTWNGIAFRAGDWIICNGEIWQRSTADDLVKSVNGLIGIVELDGSNVKATYEDETDFINNLLPKLGKVKAVNEQQPDDQGNITVDGDSINVVYEDEEDTLNNTLPKLGKVKTVNEAEPDTDGNITVDGDNINVVYEEAEDTLNNTLPKLGKVKTVDEHEPDKNGNIQLSWVGTKAEWEALDKSQLAGNGIIKLYFTDAETGSVVDKVEAGNMNPITSNAVSKELEELTRRDTIITLPTPTKEATYIVAEGDTSFPACYGTLEIKYSASKREYIAIFYTHEKREFLNFYTLSDDAWHWTGWKELATVDNTTASIKIPSFPAAGWTINDVIKHCIEAAIAINPQAINAVCAARIWSFGFASMSYSRDTVYNTSIVGNFTYTDENQYHNSYMFLYRNGNIVVKEL